jgi:hypothetical protein
MNDRSDIERVLTHWLDDGPATMPDRVVEVVARRISVRPQRPTWRLLRRSSMRPAFKYGIAAAAVLIVAVVGYALLPRSGSIGAPGPTVTPVPTATTVPTAAATPVAVTCDDKSTDCVGKLTAGVNTSTRFAPKLTFTVPDGWTSLLDNARAYDLHYNFTAAHFFQVMSQAAIPDQDAQCSAKQKAGAGNAVADWVAFLTTHPGLTTTTPTPITIDGYSGMQLDLHVADGWAATCPNSLGPAVMLATDSGAVPGRTRWIDNQQVTMRIIDVAGETLILYLESSPNPADLATVNSAFQPVIDSFAFTPGT